ncbi:hypothetical protein SAMN05421759_104358 [Roseivivax lentus]|uniref:Uncharacterized protein n=1 Tax=Roseivivax lentus TaxID=633194 RepID=A0A1N7MIX6_9RHOB|nr:hypothetical protein [Roseivivax lentus]SIS85879.1 hypothetical protein SAMN05421759_104358 [Roseivivax lentus]
MSGAAAQVTFDEVDAALSALEQSVGVTGGVAGGVSGPASISGSSVPPIAGTTPPPDVISALGGSEANEGTGEGGVDFLPILTDQACPARLTSLNQRGLRQISQVE